MHTLIEKKNKIKHLVPKLFSIQSSIKNKEIESYVFPGSAE